MSVDDRHFLILEGETYGIKVSKNINKSQRFFDARSHARRGPRGLVSSV